MLKKITHAVMALTMVAGLALSSASVAEARRGHGVAAGVAAGIIGLGILGAAAHAGRDDGCYRGPRECRWTRDCFENRYGEPVCRRAEVCDRPLICD